jgi:hypothetical protein
MDGSKGCKAPQHEGGGTNVREESPLIALICWSTTAIQVHYPTKVQQVVPPGGESIKGHRNLLNAEVVSIPNCLELIHRNKTIGRAGFTSVSTLILCKLFRILWKGDHNQSNSLSMNLILLL